MGLACDLTLKLFSVGAVVKIYFTSELAVIRLSGFHQKWQVTTSPGTHQLLLVASLVKIGGGLWYVERSTHFMRLTH